MEEVNKFFLRNFFFANEVAEHRTEAASEEGALDVVHSLADVFCSPYPSHIMMCLALSVFFEVVHEAFLEERAHLVGQRRVSRLGFRKLVVNLACRNRMVEVPDDGHNVVFRLAED